MASNSEDITTKKTSRLSFKNDNKTKKKRKSDNDKPSKSRQTKSDEENSITSTGWSRVESVDELCSPLFLLIPQNPTLGIFIDNEDSSIKLQELESQSIESLEPTHIEQILLGVQVAGSSKLYLKTSHGTYLATDKLGEVSASRLAAGLQEEWTATVTDLGVTFQSCYDTYLEYDSKTNQFRADSDTSTENQTFVILCQNKFKIKAKKDRQTKRNRKLGLTEALPFNPNLEVEKAKQFVAWNSKFKPHSSVDKELDINGLKSAYQQGTTNEYLLNKREKKKSDRHCK